jgi:hypothetical protein
VVSISTKLNAIKKKKELHYLLFLSYSAIPKNQSSKVMGFAQPKSGRIHEFFHPNFG